MRIAGHHQPDREVHRTVATASGHVMKYRAEHLLERFGYTELDEGAAEDVSKRLLALGLTIEPPLAAVKASDEVSVSIAEDATPNDDVKTPGARGSELERRVSESRTRAEQAGAQLEAARGEIAVKATRVGELEARVAELENLLSKAQQDLEHEREQVATFTERQAAEMRTREPEAQPTGKPQRSRGAKRHPPPPATPQPKAAREQAPPPAAARKPSSSPRRGRLWQRRKRPFIDRPGQCSICVRELQAAEGDLATSGWIINDETGLCPDCQRLGWTLPEGASLPSRRPTRASS